MAVIDQNRSTSLFKQAAQFAFQLGQPRESELQQPSLAAREWLGRAATLNICSGEIEYENAEFPFEKEGRDLTANFTTAMLLSAVNQYLQSENPEGWQLKRGQGILNLAINFEGFMVSRLHIPISLYTRLADTILRSSRSEGSASGQWLFEFGRRVDEQVNLAQKLGHQWRQLYTRLLPLEPEVLSGR